MTRWLYILRVLTFALLCLAVVGWLASLRLWFLDERFETLWQLFTALVSALVFAFSWLLRRPNNYPAAQEAQQEDSRAYRRNREALLANVRSIWITNGLHATLQEVARIRLNLRYTPQAVRLRYQLRTPRPPSPARVSPATSILTLFEEGGRALLILGAPGAGKTFTLLELTEALLAIAEEDDTQSIPVIFPLTSWADKQLPLDEWCVTELERHYGVRTDLGKRWMAQEEILPLRDGLDEMAESVRPACAHAINEFRRARGLLGLAVSCRKEEYEALPERLELQTAVEIQPLTPEEADDYLAQGGPDLDAARVALHTDYALAELARNPLTLSIIALAYKGVPVKGEARGTVEERRVRLFDAYIRRLFQHRAPRMAEPRTFLRWLKEVAAMMAARNSRILYLDDLQPSLLSHRQQRRYRLAVGPIVGLVLGLVMGLVSGLVGGLSAGLSAGLSVGLITGLGAGLLGALDPEGETEMVDRFAWIRPSWRRIREYLLKSLILGLVMGFLHGLVFGLVMGLVSGLIVGLVSGLIVGLISVLNEGLLASTSSREISTRQAANEVLKNTLFYALREGLVRGLVAGLVFGILGLLAGSVPGLGLGLLLGPVETLKVGLKVGLMVGLMVLLSITLAVSGQPLWYHFILRGFLAHSGRLPFRLVTFLDEAHDLLFLRRMGGGYRFYHGLLQDHIRCLDVERFDFTGEGGGTDD